MCGRYVLFTDEDYIEIRNIINELGSIYGDELSDMKTGEIFPTNTVPVITADNDNNKTVNLFKWGFPNFKQQSGVIINARGETIEEKPMFKKTIYSKRCIVPANGFYEWKASGKDKLKCFIRPQKCNFFYMAGLYNNFADKNGSTYEAFVIITTEASKEMSGIHNRMPVLLTTEEEYDGWINPMMNKLSDIKSYIHPYEHKLHIEDTFTQLQFNL